MTASIFPRLRGNDTHVPPDYIPNHRTNYRLITGTRPRDTDWQTVLPPVPNFLLVFFQGLVNQFRGRKLDKSIARSTTLAVLHDDYTIRRNRHPCHNQPTTQHSPVHLAISSIPYHHQHTTN